MTTQPVDAAARPRRRPLSVLLLATVLVGALPGGALGSDPAPMLSADGPAPVLAPAEAAPDLQPFRVSPGDEPSQMYLDLLAAEGEDLEFAPGGRVTIPFVPRADDTWSVGGVSPRGLPAGRESGAEMAAEGAPPAAPDPPAPSPAPAADPASPTPPATPGGEPAPDPAAATPGPTPDPPPGATPEPSDTAPGAPASEPAPIPAVGAAWVARDDERALAPTARGMRREVYGFLPYWEVSDSDTRLDFSIITHLAYFSLGADAKGNLKKRNADGSLTTGWGGWTSSKMTSIINAAHQKRSRVTLTLSVFAWTSGQASVQRALLGSPSARLNLARQAVAAVRDRGADGINLDFEPLVAGYDDEFVALVRTMRAELNRAARGYHLSFDTLGFPGNYPLERAVAPGGADAIFIMGYDYRTSGAGWAGSVDPLAGPAYDLADTVRTYTARVPASKVILGIPYYGRAWSTVSDAVNARTQTGAKFGYSNAVNYSVAVEYAAEHGRRYDSREVSAWVAYRKSNCSTAYGCVATWRQIYYDDAATLKARYDLVNRAGLRGAGIWALGYDGTRRELYQALADKFLNDTTPPMAGIAVQPGGQRDEAFQVAWSAIDDWNGVRSYDLQVSVDGGPWATWLAGTVDRSAWYLGRDGHGYAFRVRARDNKGNLSAWNVTSVAQPAAPTLARGGFARVVADSVNARSAPSTGATIVTTFPKGSTFALTGGPVSAGGFTWYEVRGPIAYWQPIDFVESSVWVAASGPGVTNIAAIRPPNSTLVQATLRGVSFDGVGVGTSAAALAARAFSPNGDGWEDELVLRWNARRDLESLQLLVLGLDGSVLGTVDLASARAAGDHAYSWGGGGAAGALPDGTYLLRLVGSADGITYSWPSSSPTAGGQAAQVGVRIDRVGPTLASASLSSTRLAPNGDGRFDRVTVAGSASSDAIRWELTATPAGSSAPLRRIAGSGRTAATGWDGRSDAGARAPDGRYALALRFFDAAGNPADRTWSVTLDTVPAGIAVAASPVSFSPDRDGTADSTRLSWSATDKISGWLQLVRGTKVVRRWKVAGTAGRLAWNGRDAAGRTVADGRYTLQLRGTDWFGNAVGGSARVVVDRTAGALGASPAAFFPQDGDALAPATSLTIRTIRRATVTLRILDATGTEVRRAWTNRQLGAGMHAWRWDGRVAGGAFAPRGRYTAVVTVVSPYSTIERRRTLTADAFVATPSSVTPPAGSILAVIFRSTERLREAPRGTIQVPGGSALALAVVRRADGSWRGTVRLPAAWRGPATVTLTGRDAGGRTNASSLTVTIR